MASPYELLNKLQESASKSEEQKLEEEAKRKLAKGESLSEQERQILTYGVDEMKRRKGLKEQIQDRDAQAEKYTADIAKKEEEEKEQDKIKKYQALDLPVPGSDKKEIAAPSGLGPTPDRMYNAPEQPSEAKPTSLLEATKQAQQKTKAPKPASSTEERAPLSLAGEKKAPPAKEPTIQEKLQERLSGLETRRKEAKEEREEKRKGADWGELASIIGRSLVQIGAAQQGLRTGVDMSKAVGPALIDWEKKRDRIDNDYAQEIKELNAEQKETIRLAERAEDKEAREEYQKQQAKIEAEKSRASIERERIKQEGKLTAENLKALASQNKAAIKAQFKLTEDKVKEYESRAKKINELDALIVSNADTDTIKKKAVEIFGREAVSVPGFLYGTNIASTDDIEELVKTELAQTQDALKSFKQQQMSLSPATPQIPAAPAASASKYQPGQLVEIRGKKYRVGEDGDSLVEVK